MRHQSLREDNPSVGCLGVLRGDRMEHIKAKVDSGLRPRLLFCQSGLPFHSKIMKGGLVLLGRHTEDVFPRVQRFTEKGSAT